MKEKILLGYDWDIQATIDAGQFVVRKVYGFKTPEEAEQFHKDVLKEMSDKLEAEQFHKDEMSDKLGMRENNEI